MKKILGIIILACFFFGTNVQAGHSFLDYETQRNGMHACPTNTVMTGIQYANNVFRCEQGRVSYQDQWALIDYDTQRQGMHACPFGFVMTGFHGGNNRLECVFANIIQEFVDDSTQLRTIYGWSMHICPPGWYMTGIHLGRNEFLCGK